MKAKDGTREHAFYKSVLIVKHGSPIASIQDIKGKSMAFVDPNSTSGNLVPSNEIIKAFPDAHLTMEDLHTNGKFFSAVTFSGKHQAGLQAVIKGDVDVAPISDEILKAEIRNGNATDSAVKIIFASAPIPAEPMAVRGSLPPAIKDKVKNFILTYQNDKYFEDVVGTKGARFIPCTLADYQSIIDLNHSMNK
jgi:phosphonate transport system substrate-binding protein